MKEKLIDYLIHSGETTPVILSEKLQIRIQLVNRYLKVLLILALHVMQKAV